MMKGDATWMAPSTAAPCSNVRRLNFTAKVGDVMVSSPIVGLLIIPTRCGQASGRRCASVSGRPLYLAAGRLHRSGGLFAGCRVAYREHVVRIALGRMR